MKSRRHNQLIMWSAIASLLGGASSIALAAEDKAIRPARERIIEGWLIAGSSEDEGRRKVSMNKVDSGGWPSFVDNRAKDVYDWGIRRFWLHNPFGTLSDEVMQFDQYLDAREANLDVLTENFAEAWKPVVDGSFGEPVELVAYIGTADSEDDRLKAAFESGDSAQILGTMLACVKPILMAGASIGADAAVKLSDDGPAFHFYKYLESIGVPIYVESRPKLNNPKWSDFPVFAVDDWWHRSNPALHQDALPWAMPNSDIRREVIRWIRDYAGSSTDPAVLEGLIQKTRAALLQGDTVIIRTDGLRAAGVPFERLVAGIDEQMGISSNSSGGSSVADTSAGGFNGPTLARPAPNFDAENPPKSTTTSSDKKGSVGGLKIKRTSTKGVQKTKAPAKSKSASPRNSVLKSAAKSKSASRTKAASKSVAKSKSASRTKAASKSAAKSKSASRTKAASKAAAKSKSVSRTKAASKSAAKPKSASRTKSAFKSAKK